MFWILATLLIALASLFVLVPLFKSDLSDPAAVQRRALRDARHAGVLSETEFATRSAELPAMTASPRAPLWLGAGLLLVLSAGALLGYRHFGEPDALNPERRVASQATSEQPQMSMAEAMSALEARLAASPDDLEGWMLLGRSYRSEERFADALRAFTEAQRLAPDQPDVLVDLAEAQALNAPQRVFPETALSLLHRAIELQPAHQRGHWLLGIADMQAGRPADAAARWETLLALLPSDSEARNSLIEQINSARQSANLPPLADTASAAPATAASAPASRQIRIRVSLDPALQSRTQPEASVFVFARAATGPRMPVAVERLTVAQLPAEIVLDDADSAMPSMKLSQLSEVVIGARVSASGNAIPQPGDLEVLSPAFPLSEQANELSLQINRVVE